jgi:predicted permease
MNSFRNDLVHAFRSLRRQPGFALVILLTLALGIGANTAIFSVVNGVLLRPLAYPDPNRLDFISSQFPTLGLDQFWVSPREFVEFRDHNQVFGSVGGYVIGAANFGTNPPIRPVVAAVTPEFMPTLGVRPVMGRWFTDQDSRPGAEEVAILSSELAIRAFGGTGAALEQRVVIDGDLTRIVGVMPGGYDIHDQKVEVWQPLTIDPVTLPQPSGSRHFLYLVGRLKPGVTPGQATADMDRLLKTWSTFALGPGHAPNPTTHRLRIDSLEQDIVGNVKTALFVLQGAVAFVLLIACVNLANLLLARAETRQREFAVRAALGAGRLRLFRQFMTEGLLLTTIATLAGIGVADAGLVTLLRMSAGAIPRAAEIGLDWHVLAFTLGLATLSSVGLGLVPLLHLDLRLAASLRSGARETGGAARRRVRGALVVAEVMLAVMLVVGAGLLVRSLINLTNVDAGFNRSRLVTFGLVPSVPSGQSAAGQRVDVFNRVITALASVPGVQHAAGMSGLPPNRPVSANDTFFEFIPNDPVLARAYPQQSVDYWQLVSPDYTDTLGIPVIKGRAFQPSDVTGPPVALVNEALVRHFFKDRDPIGQRVKPAVSQNAPWFTIVGVLKDLKQHGVDAPAGTELTLLNDQLPRTLDYAAFGMNVVLRTSLPIETLAGSIQRVVSSTDPSLPIVKLQTMDDAFGAAVSRPRFLTWLLGIFAALALVLAAVGTYGVLSYVVIQRRQEIGIRMALGADRSSVLGLVLRQGLMLSCIGLGGGVAGALAMGRVLRSLLFEVQPTDPATLVGVVVLIALVAVAACILPAWRAAGVDPLAVLRQS